MFSEISGGGSGYLLALCWCLFSGLGGRGDEADMPGFRSLHFEGVTTIL